MDLRGNDLYERSSDSLKSVTIHNSYNKGDFANECKSQQKPKIESDLDASHKEFDSKQESNAVKFNFEPIKEEVDNCMNMQTELKYNIGDGFYCVTFKREPEDEGFRGDIPDQYLSERCTNDQEAIDCLSNVECSLQAKSEPGFDNGLPRCNLESEALKRDIKPPNNEVKTHGSMHFNAESDGLSFEDMYSKETEWFICNSCGYKTKSEELLKSHDESHSEHGKTYHCQFCECKYKHKSALLRHVGCEHNENHKWYQCSFCDYKTKHKSSLVYHFRVQHDENSEAHQCQFCEYKSKDKSSLRKHIKYKHNEGAEIYQCKFCEGKYKNHSDLKRHLKYMHNENVKLYQCSYCNLKTKYKHHLDSHIKVQHDKDCKKYQCQFCELKFKYERDIKRHINFKHSENVIWHQCNYCDHKTKYKRYLMSHLKAKHSENPEVYQCCFCNCKFKYRDSLRKHVDRKHKNKAS